MSGSSASPDFRVEVKVLDPRVFAWGLPRRHSDLAAGVDLYACVDDRLVVPAESSATLVSSGLAVYIGVPNVAGLIVPRSGRGHGGLVLGNAIGILDADYSGPLMISVWNRRAAGTEPIVIEPGDRIAQLIFVPVLHPVLEVVEAFSSESVRGAGGFGSTGLAARTGEPRAGAR